MEPSGTIGPGEDSPASATADADALSRLQRQLGERIKEKNCLIEVMRATAMPGLDAPAMCQRVVALVPAGWQYPAVAQARLAWGEQCVQTAGFRPTPWMQEAGFTMPKGATGKLTVAYLEERETADEGPFLREERDLIEALATHIGASLANLAVSESLREREEILSSIVGLAADSIGLVDISSGRFVEFNEAAHRNLGYTREEFARLGVPDIEARGLSAEALKTEFDAIVAAGEAVVETRHRRRDGAIRDVRVTARHIRVRDHDYLSAIWSDITERKAAEETLRKLSLAVEQSPEGVIITDLDARIEYVNPAFTRHTGYTREEVLGRNPRFLGAGTTPRATYLDMWAALTAGRTWKGEFRNRRKDGREQIEAATIIPQRQPDGRVSHYVALKEDITERKLMAAELERHREHLESLVEERTLALAEARERAEAANRAKSAFLANMSHEIRTPMNAILGLTHLILCGNTTPEQADRLRKIDAAGRHLLSIINDILDISKVESGKLTLEHVDFDLHASIQEACDACFRGTAGKDLVLRKEFDPALPRMVNGDPLRLNQVLLNLGGNAVKFTERGTITLRVLNAGFHEGNPRVRFEIEDTGIGMSGEQCARLFQPFEQADTSTTRKYGGTGLGLAISRRLVELMGGRIEVASRPGEGSKFSFTIPLRAGQGAETPEHPAAGQAAGRPATVREIRILLVEDDPINQEVGSELLRDAGYRVDVADNGAVALERAAGATYDLVLMDMQMPVMDGIAAARALRELPAYASTPILAMTANAFHEDRQACFAAGMNDFISKPVDPPHLFAAIDRWTGRAPGPAGGTAPVPVPDAQARDAPLATLANLLAADDFEATVYFHANATVLRRALGATAPAVEAHITGYRFDQALPLVLAARGLAGDIGA